MQHVKRLIVEMHRRSIWKVLGVYLVGSWVGYQVITELTDRVGLPDWVPAFAIVLFVIGLPIVLATAMVQEGAPSFRRSQPDYAPTDPTLLPIDQTLLPESATPDRRATPAPPRGLQHQLLTWNKAIVGGIVAFFLLGTTAAGYVGLRNAGVGPFGSLLATGELSNRERMVIADFQTVSGDTSLAAAVTEAFRMDFAQTPVVTVVEPAYVREVLQRMSRDPKSKLDADLAREVAIRDNIKAYLAGELSRAGTKYIIAAKLVSAKDATVLASFRETATDSTVIIDAVDRLSKSLRERIGESFRLLRADKPLEAVSTPSLDALLKYTRGVYAIDVDRDFDAGISMLQEAIAADSGFAMAWRKLAVAYSNSGRGRDLVVSAAIKTYQFRDRLTDIERYGADAYYHMAVVQDDNKAISAYELLRDRDPTASTNNLGLLYRNVHDYEKAAEAFREAIRRDSMLAVAHGNLFGVLFDLGRRDEAEQVAAMVERKFPTDPMVQQLKAGIAYASGDLARTAEAIRRAGSMRRSPAFQASTEFALADLTLVQGKLAEASRHRATGSAIQFARGNVWAPLNRELWEVHMDFDVRRDPVRAGQRLRAALAQYPLEPIPPVNRPYFTIANLYALTGDVAQARSTIEEFERSTPAELRGNRTDDRLLLDGVIALTEKRYSDAVDFIRRSVEAAPCNTCLYTTLALAFEAASQPDSAIAYLEAHIATLRSNAVSDAFVLAPSYERLAELYEQKGNREKAAIYAGKFVELWQNADAELQPRVQAKKQMLSRLNERR